MNIAETSDPPPEAERQRAASQVANVIAHDIETALAPIKLYTEALLEHETLSDRARQYLASIRRAAADVSQTAARLRELDRTHALEPQHTGTQNLRRLPVTRSLRVLVIDDDPSVTEALRSSLIDEGHKVSVANGGQAGIDAFQSARGTGTPFDIVITDLSMPEVDGHQVVVSLRAISPGTPIILLTGWRHQLNDGDERLMRVDRLLGKPPRIRELRAALAELTGRRAGDRLG